MKENEREFQGWIIDTAERFGWRVWHAPTPMRPVGKGQFVPDPRGAGLPDLVLLHDDPPRLILAEVKAEGGVLSEAQREFLKLARDVAEVCEGIEGFDDEKVPLLYRPFKVFVWKPVNRDLIEATLRSS